MAHSQSYYFGMSTPEPPVNAPRRSTAVDTSLAAALFSSLGMGEAALHRDKGDTQGLVTNALRTVQAARATVSMATPVVHQVCRGEHRQEPQGEGRSIDTSMSPACCESDSDYSPSPEASRAVRGLARASRRASCSGPVPPGRGSASSNHFGAVSLPPLSLASGSTYPPLVGAQALGVLGVAVLPMGGSVPLPATATASGRRPMSAKRLIRTRKDTALLPNGAGSVARLQNAYAKSGLRHAVHSM